MHDETHKDVVELASGAVFCLEDDCVNERFRVSFNEYWHAPLDTFKDEHLKARIEEARIKRDTENYDRLEKINDFINLQKTDKVKEVIDALISAISTSDLSNKETTLQNLRDTCAKIESIKFMYFMQVLRIAIFENLAGPNLIDVLEIIPKELLIKRLKKYFSANKK